MTGDKIDFGHGAIDHTSPIATLLLTGAYYEDERHLSIVNVERVDDFTDEQLNPHYNVSFASSEGSYNATGTLRQCCEAAFSTLGFTL